MYDGILISWALYFSNLIVAQTVHRPSILSWVSQDCKQKYQPPGIWKSLNARGHVALEFNFFASTWWPHSHSELVSHTWGKRTCTAVVTVKSVGRPPTQSCFPWNGFNIFRRHYFLHSIIINSTSYNVRLLLCGFCVVTHWEDLRTDWKVIHLV